MSVFLDANIIFSASNAQSNLRRLLDFLRNKETFITSDYARSEAERNIASKRSQWFNGYHDLMACIEIAPEATLTIDAGLPDKDSPILGAAIGARADYLLTGDKRDFGHLYGRTIEGVTVTPVMEFAALMMQKHKQE